MSFFKLNGSICVALTTLVVLAMSTWAAIAAPTTLVCTNDQQPNDKPFIIDLDQTKNTVTLNFPVGQQGAAARSVEFKATFDAKEIKFDDNRVGGGVTVYNAWTIDRLTGIVTDLSGVDAPYSMAAPKDRAVMHDTCHVGKAQF